MIDLSSPRHLRIYINSVCAWLNAYWVKFLAVCKEVVNSRSINESCSRKVRTSVHRPDTCLLIIAYIFEKIGLMVKRFKNKNFKGILIVCVLGFLLRASLSSVFIHYDVYAHKLQALALTNLTFREMYSNIPGRFTPYLPMHYYVHYPLGYLFKALSFNENTPGFFPNLLIKLPIYLADTLAAFVIWLIVKKKYSEKNALIAACCYFFHPAVLYVSTIVGQIEGLIILFMLLAFYFINENRLVLGSLSMTVALLFKPIAFIIIPLFIFLLVWNFPLKKLVAPFLLSLLLVLLAFYPFTIGRSYFWVYDYVKKLADTYLFTSVYALNIWGLEGFMRSDLRLFLGMPLKKWGLYTVYLVVIALFAVVIKRKAKIKDELMYLLALLSFYTTYMFATRMLGGRFLIFIFVFFPIVFFRKRELLIPWILSSIVVVLNMTHVYDEHNLPLAKFISSSRIVIDLLIFANFIAYFWVVKVFLKITSQNQRLS